jgi:Ni,Fe-hydrogenase III component G
VGLVGGDEVFPVAVAGQAGVSVGVDAAVEHKAQRALGVYFQPLAGTDDAAAAWAEREINELIGVDFDGLDTSSRLFLPENMLDGKGQITVTSIEQLRRMNGLD